MKSSAARALVLGLPFATAACDPGWVYEAERGTPIQDNGLRYDVPSPRGVAARIHAGAFTSSLSVELSLRNTGTALLEAAAPRLEVSAAGGGRLPMRSPATSTCPHQDGMRIPPGKTCTIATSFEIVPLVPGLIRPRDNPALERIVVHFRASEPRTIADLDIPMVWVK